MFDKFIQWLTKRQSQRMITRDDKPYLERFYIFSSKYLTILLHRFHSSDPDDFHDHPFDNITVLLKGRYREDNVDGTFNIARPWYIKFRTAEQFHRIRMIKDTGPTWSLFIHFKRRRDWGFLKKEDLEWIPASMYARQAVEI